MSEARRRHGPGDYADEREAAAFRLQCEAIGRELAKNSPGDKFSRFVIAAFTAAAIAGGGAFWQMQGAVASLSAKIENLVGQVMRLEDRLLYQERRREERGALPDELIHG